MDMPNRFCLCWAFCVETFHQRRNIEILHTILWFHKNVQYVGDGYVLATELLGEENFLSQIGHHPSQIFNSGAEARGSQSCK